MLVTNTEGLIQVTLEPHEEAALKRRPLPSCRMHAGLPCCERCGVAEHLGNEVSVALRNPTQASDDDDDVVVPAPDPGRADPSAGYMRLWQIYIDTQPSLPLTRNHVAVAGLIAAADAQTALCVAQDEPEVKAAVQQYGGEAVWLHAAPTANVIRKQAINDAEVN